MSDAIKIYVPREAAAVSLGADEVAERIASAAKKSKADVAIIRNGSWGITWLEPMVEVSIDGQRIAFHQDAIGIGAAITFIGVAGDVFLFAGRVGDGLPFDAGRKPGAAPSSEPRCLDLFKDMGCTCVECFSQTGEAAVRLVFIE